MTGWSKITDGSALDLHTKEEFLFDLESKLKGFVNCGDTDKIRLFFNQLVSCFLKESCVSNSFRPLPPMLGDGKCVDLLKLYLVVREKGGYESVSKDGLWDLVANESGFDLTVTSGLKLVYAKYLALLEKWFAKVVKDKESESGLSSMDVTSEFKGFFAEFSDQKKKSDEGYAHLDLKIEELDFKSDEINSCVDPAGVKDCASGKASVDDHKDNVILKSGEVKEDECSRKRKRESQLAFLAWVRNVAKDPCDPVTGLLPERSKWKSCESEHVWKQVLLAREAMLVTRSVDSTAEQSIWQIKQKMHPTMYDDHTERSNSRCSRRIISAKESRAVLSFKKSQSRELSDSSSLSQSDVEGPSAVDSFWANNHKQKRVPLGPYFQAKVPAWTDKTYESEERWLGTPIWPPGKGEHRSHLIERDRIGKGRQDSCGCQFPGSIECVRFHVAEKRIRVKLELGSAFYKWKFDYMGEEASLSWTRDEQKKFQDIVKSNPSSLGKCFWDEICKSFPRKNREVLVSYYFNAYLLGRRGQQNRSTPSSIDSDDDELENNGVKNEVLKSPGSILCSPKKVHLNCR